MGEENFIQWKEKKEKKSTSDEEEQLLRWKERESTSGGLNLVNE